MSDPTSTVVKQYSVTLAGSTSPTVVTAQTFDLGPDGSLVLRSDRGQAVAAFHAGAWTYCLPVAST
jgi:hypothetical protein